VFLRSFVDFDGLTADEILARLFLWWFGPGFLTLFLRLIVPTPVSLDVSSAATTAGIVLTGLVVLRDAQRAGLANPWMWAVVTAVVPLIGWWMYGRARAPDIAIAIPEYTGRPSPLARYVNPFWRARLELVTRLSPEQCAERLNALNLNWMSPRQWFSSQRERPVRGSVSPRGFSVRWRHSLSRPGMLTEASARFEKRDGVTAIHLRLGESVGDRVLVLLWLAIALLLGVPLALRPSPSAPVSFDQLWIVGWVGLFVLLYLLIRAISRDDDLRLRRLIMDALEAEELSGPTRGM
jgi:hypothetical protein